VIAARQSSGVKPEKYREDWDMDRPLRTCQVSKASHRQFGRKDGPTGLDCGADGVKFAAEALMSRVGREPEEVGHPDLDQKSGWDSGHQLVEVEMHPGESKPFRHSSVSIFVGL
jgi:hypothetical protein